MIDVATIVLVTAGTFTSIGSAIAGWYYVTRIGIEKKRSIEMQDYQAKLLKVEVEKAKEQKRYYEEMLTIERAKLEVRRGAQ